MADLFLVLAFSLSTGAFVLYGGLSLKRMGLLKTKYKVTSPDCLGRMPNRHNKYCSEVCPLSARCALLAMDDYMRRYPGMLFSSDNSEQH